MVTPSFAILARRLRELWPVIVVVGLPAATALAIQQTAQCRRPADDLNDVNGVAHHAVARILAVLAGFILAPQICVALAATSRVIEGLGVRSALRRSRALTKGRRGRAILLSALLVWIEFSVPGLIGGVLLLMIGWPFWLTNFVSIAATAILLPFSPIGRTLQFYDFRSEDARNRSLAAPVSRLTS